MSKSKKISTLVYQGALIPPVMDNLEKGATSSDDADQAKGEMFEPRSYTEEEEKAVLRKIDSVILPFVRGSSCLPGSFSG